MLERREGNHHDAGSAKDIGEEDHMERSVEKRSEDGKEEDKRKKRGAKEDNKNIEEEEEEEEEEFYSRVFDPQQHITEEIDSNRISGGRGVVSVPESGGGDVNLKGGGGGILRGRTKNRRRKRAPSRHVTLEEEMTGKKLGRENVSKFSIFKFAKISKLNGTFHLVLK